MRVYYGARRVTKRYQIFLFHFFFRFSICKISKQQTIFRIYEHIEWANFDTAIYEQQQK